MKKLNKEVIRYERLSKKDPEYKSKMKAQLAKFGDDAKAGKVLCLSVRVGVFVIRLGSQ